MLSMFFICLCFLALYGNAVNQTRNNTHFTCAYCSLGHQGSQRHLGVSLYGQSICSKLMEETEYVTNLSCGRLPQRDMVCFCCIALCENTLNQTGNNTNVSCTRCSLGHLAVSLCCESTCWKALKETASFLTSFCLMITLICYMGLLLLRRVTEYTRTIVKQHRRYGSGYWTRRRVYWRRRKISRAAYIAEAL